MNYIYTPKKRERRSCVIRAFSYVSSSDVRKDLAILFSLRYTQHDSLVAVRVTSFSTINFHTLVTALPCYGAALTTVWVVEGGTLYEDGLT